MARLRLLGRDVEQAADYDAVETVTVDGSIVLRKFTAA